MLRKTTLFVISLCLAAVLALAAETNLAGTWEAQGSNEGKMQSWQMKFDVKGDKFVGTWGSAENGNVREIKEGQISGKDFSFKVVKQDGSIAMLCKGTINGDKMTLNIENTSEGERRQATASRKAGN